MASSGLYMPQIIFSHHFCEWWMGLGKSPYKSSWYSCCTCQDMMGEIHLWKIEGGGGNRLYLYIVKIGNFTRVLMPFLTITLLLYLEKLRLSLEPPKSVEFLISLNNDSFSGLVEGFLFRATPVVAVENTSSRPTIWTSIFMVSHCPTIENSRYP